MHGHSKSRRRPAGTDRSRARRPACPVGARRQHGARSVRGDRRRQGRRLHDRVEADAGDAPEGPADPLRALPLARLRAGGRAQRDAAPAGLDDPAAGLRRVGARTAPERARRTKGRREGARRHPHASRRARAEEEVTAFFDPAPWWLALAGWSVLVALWHTSAVALAFGAWRLWRRSAPAAIQYRAASAALALAAMLTLATPAALLLRGRATPSHATMSPVGGPA